MHVLLEEPTISMHSAYVRIRGISVLLDFLSFLLMKVSESVQAGRADVRRHLSINTTALF